MKKTVVLGLGATGISCARFLQAQQIPFVLLDTRESPPNLESVKSQFPNTDIHLGQLPESLLSEVKEIILSPGVARDHPILDGIHKSNIAVIGDIELFLRYAKAPVVAVTGSNGKSTVTSMLGYIVQRLGIQVRIGGNLGEPALSLLDPLAEYYILELSSYQLESIFSLNAVAVTLLNISPDHLDRYPSMENYLKAKQRIFQNNAVAICNKDQSETYRDCDLMQCIYFSEHPPSRGEFGLCQEQGNTYLAFGEKCLLAVSQLKLIGRHNWINALATLALGQAMGLSLDAMIEHLPSFPGLEHRLQWIGQFNGVDFYNDSKATNVGAAIASLQGLADNITGQIILIAGGDGKAQDFTEMSKAMAQVKKAIVFGKDAQSLTTTLQSVVEVINVSNLNQAVQQAVLVAESGDAVLLAPACSSLDMYKNFEARGLHFQQCVNELMGSTSEKNHDLC